MPSPSAAAISRASASGVHHGAGRIGRARDHARRRAASLRCAAMQRLAAISAQRVAAVGLDQHRLAAERGQDMPVRRIAGIGDRHPVARLEQRQKRQDEAARRAGGHHDARRIEREAVGLAIMPRDARAQRRNARASRCSRCGRAPSAACAAAIAVRGAGAAGWPTSMWTTRPPVRLDARRRRHHVHDHERRHIAARGGRQQRVSPYRASCRRLRPAGRPAPLLPYSAACLPILALAATRRDRRLR